MEIDYLAIERVLGYEVAERLGDAAETLMDTLSDAPAVLCLAYERSIATGCSMGDAVTQLLDELDTRLVS